MKATLLKLLSPIIILSAASQAKAQWSHIPSIANGAIANDGAVTFTFGDKGYVVAGATTNIMYRYDTTANSWSNLGPVPAGMGHAFAMGFTLHGKGYVVGGDTAGVPVNTVWRFDPANTTTPWTQLNNFDGGLRDAGIAFVVNDTAYVGLGFNGTSLSNDLWRYDEANDNWIQVTATLPTVLMFPGCFVIDNRAFIVTGSTNGVAETSQMWEYNTSTQTFTSKAPFPGDERQAALAFSNDHYGYLGGGMANYTDNFYDMWRYNPNTDVWTAAGNVPLYGASWASVFTIGNTAYAGIGARLTQTGLEGLDSFYRYRMHEPTSVKEISTHKQLALYPNPAADVLYLDVPTAGEIAIYNILGMKLRSAPHKPNAPISLSGLAPGFYTIILSTNGETWHGTFLKK